SCVGRLIQARERPKATKEERSKPLSLLFDFHRCRSYRHRGLEGTGESGPAVGSNSFSVVPLFPSKKRPASKPADTSDRCDYFDFNQSVFRQARHLDCGARGRCRREVATYTSFICGNSFMSLRNTVV